MEAGAVFTVAGTPFTEAVAPFMGGACDTDLDRSKLERLGPEAGLAYNS